MTGRTRLLFAVLLALGATGVSTPAQTPTDIVTVFSNARLIQLGATPGVSDAAIMVRNGRVAAVGPVASIAVPTGARRVDLGGRFVLPGLISTHVHVSDVTGPEARAYTDENTKRQLSPWSRYGITSVLSLGGEQAPAFTARLGQASVPLDRSRIFLSGDIIYDGPLIDDAYHSVVEDYVSTLERLAGLPVSIVHGGHFPSFGPVRYRQLIAEYLAGHRKPGCHLG